MGENIELERTDYMDPICPFDTSGFVKKSNINASSIDVKEILSYADELYSIKEYGKAQKMLEEYLLKAQTLGDKTGELGICITPKFQDKHYGSEAISRMIKYGFEELDLDEIILVVFSNNLRAVHCYKKAGFVEYKKVLNVTNIDGEDVDDIYMSLKRK